MVLPKLTKFLKNRSGFTMIELLVVIAVIGVLAVAVLSSINPIEQVNKGRDTRTRSDAAQLLNAVDRYYAIQEVYPWNDLAGLPAGDELPATEINSPDGELMTAYGGDWLQFLVDTAEVKQSFYDRISTDDGIYVYKEGGADGDTATTYACFVPRSRQFQLEAAKKCASGTIVPDVDNGGAVDVYCVNDRTGTQVDGQYICLP